MIRVMRNVEGRATRLARVHARTTAVRSVDVALLERSRFPTEPVRDAARAWHARALTEYASMQRFTTLAADVQRFGLPLACSTALLRMASDEARHADLCLRLAHALGGPDEFSYEAAPRPCATLDELRVTTLALFAVAETISVRMFASCARAATVPVARAAVRAILGDEIMHADAGWEIAALVVRRTGREDDLARIVEPLERAIEGVARQCHAEQGPPDEDSPDASPSPNFGTLTANGYAREFYKGIAEDVDPGFAALGIPRSALGRYASGLAFR